MPDTFTLPEDVTKARENAKTLTAGAAGALAGENTIGDVLSQKVRDLYNNNEDIINKLDTATSEYLSAPSVAREKYLTPTSPDYQPNPFAAERLVNQYANTSLIPFLSYSGIYGQRMGRFQDLIGAGTNAYMAQSARQQAQAQEARTTYEDLLNEYLSLQQLGLRQQEINKPSGGGGTVIQIGGLEGLDTGLGGVTLTDPNTGRVYQYESVEDPDFIQDYKDWYLNAGRTPTTPQNSSGTLKGIGAYSLPYG